MFDSPRGIACNRFASSDGAGAGDGSLFVLNRAGPTPVLWLRREKQGAKEQWVSMPFLSSGGGLFSAPAGMILTGPMQLGAGAPRPQARASSGGLFDGGAGALMYVANEGSTAHPLLRIDSVGRCTSVSMLARPPFWGAQFGARLPGGVTAAQADAREDKLLLARVRRPFAVAFGAHKQLFVASAKTKDALGPLALVTLAATPNPPRRVRAQVRSCSAAEVEWAAGDDCGDAVRAYIVSLQYGSGAGGHVDHESIVVDGAFNRSEFGQLFADTSYSFRVTAVNAFGRSQPSEASQVIFTSTASLGGGGCKVPRGTRQQQNAILYFLAFCAALPLALAALRAIWAVLRFVFCCGARKESQYKAVPDYLRREAKAQYGLVELSSADSTAAPKAAFASTQFGASSTAPQPEPPQPLPDDDELDFMEL